MNNTPCRRKRATERWHIAVELRLIKLGGAVITQDGCEGLFHHENVRRIVRELLPYAHNCILVHGTGLVGKRPAVENGYFRTGRIPASDSQLAVAVRRSLRELNSQVLRLLLEAGIRALPMDTPQCFNTGGNGLRQDGLGESFAHAARQGGVPVFYGDLMPQPDGSFQVTSSDAIMSVLARALRPEKAYMFTDVDGVYGWSKTDLGCSGPVMPTLTESNVAEMYRSPRDAADVSGGMGEKVQHAFGIARHCGSCTIASGLAPGVVAKVLAGDDVVCTRVVAS